ncbi:MAG: hypothetical protein JNM95_06090 [Chitinophagaceae bacterium]|nr:hypothetical protein [Chitinophagaceae bacterium]
MKVSFSVQFKGGTNGYLSLKIFDSTGAQVGKSIEFENSGTKSRELGPDEYVVSIGGMSTEGGTQFTINTETEPTTPKSYKKGINDIFFMLIN